MKECASIPQASGKFSSLRGFTLVELLVVIMLLAILAALAIPGYDVGRRYCLRAGCTTNMRQLGMAFLMYSGENDSKLPPRATGKDAQGNPIPKWPVLLWDYLHDYRVYVDPGDPKTSRYKPADLISNTANYGSFFFNGLNDLNTLDDPTIQLNLNTLTDRSDVLLLGEKKQGDHSFYMDLLEKPHGNQNDVLNKTAYGTGSVYVFSDGSARFIPLNQYDDTLWLANKDFKIPQL